MREPEYACALLSDPRQWWLLQLRAPVSRVAPNQLTCFGGRCEPGESALACLRRELQEEIGWCPEQVQPAVDLWQEDRFIARFYRGRLATDVRGLRIEPGSLAILAPVRALPGLPLSPWHRSVLEAASGLPISTSPGGLPLPWRVQPCR